MRHGFLLVDKPIGPTSHDAVQTVRRLLQESKAGHLGTLDPNASGLLVVAVGAKALKVIEFFSSLTKEYEAEIQLGAVSSTYDAEGVIEKRERKPGWEIPEQATIQRLIDDHFIGTLQQVPPLHSAIHHEGKRAYDLARSGSNVVLPARTVEIADCKVISYDYPVLKLRITCGSGTYIRSFASDIGEKLNCGGYLKNLRRTKVGSWSVADAVAPDKAVWPKVIALKDVLANFPKVELTDDEANDIKHGRGILREIHPDIFGWHQGLPIAVLVPIRPGAKTAKPRKVL